MILMVNNDILFFETKFSKLSFSARFGMIFEEFIILGRYFPDNNVSGYNESFNCLFLQSPLRTTSYNGP